MILMDFNEHISLVHEEMKPIKFNIRENTGSFWGKLEMIRLSKLYNKILDD